MDSGEKNRWLSNSWPHCRVTAALSKGSACRSMNIFMDGAGCGSNLHPDGLWLSLSLRTEEQVICLLSPTKASAWPLYPREASCLIILPFCLADENLPSLPAWLRSNFLHLPQVPYSHSYREGHLPLYLSPSNCRVRSRPYLPSEEMTYVSDGVRHLRTEIVPQTFITHTSNHCSLRPRWHPLPHDNPTT